MSGVRGLTKTLLPPVLAASFRRLRKHRQVACPPSDGHGPGWEYVPEGWYYQTVHPEVRGWDVQEIADTYARKWPLFLKAVQGTGPLGVAHESDLTSQTAIVAHNQVMTFAYVLATAAVGRERLTLLDWGGGVGHYHLFAQALFPRLRVDYCCRDLPGVVVRGRELLPGPEFVCDDSCLDAQYDLVMASGSLHYSEDWRRLLGNLARATREYLFVTSVPTIQLVDSFVFVQRPYAYGYNTEYLGWCVNRQEMLGAAASVGLDLVREFVVGYAPVIQGAPEQNEYRGYLFERARSKLGQPSS